MHMLLARACNPALTLCQCMHGWRDIATRLSEARRKRRYQCVRD
jgi:hypothetical protein